MLVLPMLLAVGSLTLILIGLARSHDAEPSAARVRARRLTVYAGMLLFFLALAWFSQSYVFLKLRLESAQSTLEAVQTSMASTRAAFADLPAQTPPPTSTLMPTNLTPLATITPTAVPDSVAIESLGAFIYDLSGRESGKGSSNSDLNIYTYRDIPYPFYNLRYTTANDQSYTSLTFFFWDKFDLTPFSSVQFTVQFQDQLTLCYFSISGTRDSKAFLLGEEVHYTDNMTVQMNETARGREYTFTIPVDPVLEPIGPAETIYIQFYSNQTLSAETRDDSYTVSNIKFVR